MMPNCLEFFSNISILSLMICWSEGLCCCPWTAFSTYWSVAGTNARRMQIRGIRNSCLRCNNRAQMLPSLR